MTTTTSDRTGTQTRRGGLAHRLYTGEISYDFVGHRRLWYIVSAILLSVSLGGLLLRGLDLTWGRPSPRSVTTGFGSRPGPWRWPNRPRSAA